MKKGQWQFLYLWSMEGIILMALATLALNEFPHCFFASKNVK
jgi:hypothetical protein